MRPFRGQPHGRPRGSRTRGDPLRVAFPAAEQRCRPDLNPPTTGVEARRLLGSDEAATDPERFSQLMSKNILIVEDDERIRTAVRLVLEEEGYAVVETESGEAALEVFAPSPSDVVLIDIMLPGIDGFEVCRRIRRLSEVPIIMVTARDDSHDIVAGLEAGADDYLSKPFDPKVLSARIRALLRRSRPSETAHPHLIIDQLELLADEGTVRVAGHQVHLTHTEFRLLVELASNPNKVFSREDLLEAVWDYGYLGDGRLVDVHIRRLRTKIELDPANPRYVITVRGMGYKLQT